MATNPCLHGSTLSGGGFDILDDSLAVHVSASKPEADQTWKIFASNTDLFTMRFVEVYAVCPG